MYCVKCGNKLVADAKFCTSCGTAVETLATTLDKHVPAGQISPTAGVATNSAEIDGASSFGPKASHGIMRKAGIATAAVLLTILLALHNPIDGYDTKEYFCDEDAIRASGGPYQPKKDLLGRLSDSEAMKIVCHDMTGNDRHSWRDLSIFDYESRSAIFQPLSKVSGLLFGSTLVCILLAIWLRLYDRS